MVDLWQRRLVERRLAHVADDTNDGAAIGLAADGIDAGKMLPRERLVDEDDAGRLVGVVAVPRLRPLRMGTPMAAKYPGVTVRISIVGRSSSGRPVT